MNILPTPLDGVVVIEPKVFGDDRGFFMETWHAEKYRQAGIAGPFVQDNLSRSALGVLRGLHYQHPHGQGKLVWVLEGEVFDVFVDIRRGSPTFGQWHGERLSATNKRQMFAPAGFAHGFCVLSESALFAYKCTEAYHPEAEHTLLWNDPDLAIDWPLDAPSLSPKDAQGLPLQYLPSLPPNERPTEHAEQHGS
jgi:dTDP-4-dehydrorhamnose 3,5-epimerase